MAPSNASTIDTLLGAVLQGEVRAWPFDHTASAMEAFHSRARYHGVGPLVLHKLPPDAPGWPAGVVQSLRGDAFDHALWELRHRQLLSQVLGTLDAAGVHPVLIKGTALAYSIYPSALSRSRGDTDLLIPRDARNQVHDTLVTLGFRPSIRVSGEFISYQASYTASEDDGVHVLDLHWKINNSELLSRLFSYAELRASARPLPALCGTALAAAPAHALLIACMHRGTHRQNPYFVDGVAHYEGNRLVWLHDIQLLTAQLTSREWDEVLRLATQKGLRAVLLDGLEEARSRLGAMYPKGVRAALEADGRAEPAARYLNSRKLVQQWMDFLALQNPLSQLRFIRELLFPSPQYMRGKYPGSHPAWLPWLYVKRAAAGLAKALAVRKTGG